MLLWDRQQLHHLRAVVHVMVALDAIDVQRLMQAQHLRQLCMGCQAVNADEDGAEAVLVTKHPDISVDDGQPAS